MVLRLVRRFTRLIHSRRQRLLSLSVAWMILLGTLFFSLPRLTLGQGSSLQATVPPPIIFVHGIGQNANDMGTTDPVTGAPFFRPLFQQLQMDVGPIDRFKYVDDRAYGNACPQPSLGGCVSQSSVSSNAVALANTIRSDFQASGNQSVTLIGYSMGAAIIRTVLAGCPGPTSSCTDVPGLVKNVFFLDGVQQGSYLMPLKQGLSITSDLVALWSASVGNFSQAQKALALPWIIYSAVKNTMGLDVNDPAEQDLAPLSPNIVAHNLVAPPSQINYYNFYGDIQAQSFFMNHGHKITLPGTLPLGDLVLFPGDSNPQSLPVLGGARFCEACVDKGGYETSQPDPFTSYTQWPMTTVIDYNLASLTPCLKSLSAPSLSPSLATQCLGSLASAPQMHTNIENDASLDGDIQVKDITGHSGTTNISQEITWILQSQEPTPIPTPTPTPQAGWGIVPNFTDTTTLMGGVLPLATNKVWFVGNDADGILIGWWDGTTFTRTSLNNPYVAELTGISAVSPDDIWVVGGQSLDGVTITTVAEHWDGVSWTTIPTPTVSTIRSEFSSVIAIASDDVWAVGSYSVTSHTGHSLLEHWDGTAWSVVDGAIDATLAPSSIAASGPNDMWIMGLVPVGSSTAIEAEHWDGTTWSIIPTALLPPHLGASLDHLTVLGPNDVWAAGGYQDTSFHNQWLIEHWDGTTWSIIPSLSPGNVENLLYGFTAAAPNDAWAVGTYDGPGGNNQTLVEHWDGSAWTIVPSQNPTSTGYNALYTVAVAPNGVWAVGRYIDGPNAHGLIEFYPR